MRKMMNKVAGNMKVTAAKTAMLLKDKKGENYVDTAVKILIAVVRLMEIMECEITPDGKRHFNSLFRYEITENRVEGDKFIINGTHKKVCGISESLKKRFLENGMPREVLNKITGGGASVC